MPRYYVVFQAAMGYPVEASSRETAVEAARQALDADLATSPKWLTEPDSWEVSTVDND